MSLAHPSNIMRSSDQQPQPHNAVFKGSLYYGLKLCPKACTFPHEYKKRNKSINKEMEVLHKAR